MITDPISDFLTRLRNAQAARHTSVAAPASKVKVAIAKILEEEGFIEGVSVDKNVPKATLRVNLKYNPQREPMIRNIRRVSRPGRRVYRPFDKLPRVLSDAGIAIISTSSGLMTNKQARKRHLGGEVLCEIY